jgi:2-methylaconitate isomerase
MEEQIALRCVLMRGGTSKGLYFHEDDLPAPGEQRDRLLKRAMGSPDVMQIDGLGGSRLVTSKIAIVKRSARDDADVDYTFAQVDIERDIIGYDGNCGNISSGVGPFAVDEGLVEAVEPLTRVRIYNTNTQKVLVAQVSVAGGKARVSGDFAIAGVPGTGAPILMDYADTVGAKTGRLLPTGNAADSITLESGATVTATVCDAANPCVFVRADELGLRGDEMPEVLMADKEALARIFEIQAKAGQLMGLYEDWRAVHKPGLPLFVAVAGAAAYTDRTGARHDASEADLQARLLFLGKCHDSMAGTGAICTAAASRVRGSVVFGILNESARHAASIRIAHPLGVMEVAVRAGDVATDSQGGTAFEALGFLRTARRLMTGHLHVPQADLSTG